MIPLKDNIPTSRFPVVTVVLIALNVVVFAWQLTFSSDVAKQTNPGLRTLQISPRDENSVEYGAIPFRILHPGRDCAAGVTDLSATEATVVCRGTPEYAQAEAAAATDPIRDPLVDLGEAFWLVTVFASMFMHGGILHIGFNMLFLWIFGNNVEDAMGRAKFTCFYLLAGVAALYSQAAIDPSATVPTIGASGAVAGVLGAYALLHPQARILTLIFLVFFVTIVEIPALVLLGIWFLLQFLPALGQVATPDVAGGGVAYFAHVGGFLFGLAAVKLFAARGTPIGLRQA